MFRKALYFGLFIMLVVVSAGCATAPKANLETQGLRNQVLALEAQLQDKELENSNLRESLNRTTGKEATLKRQFNKKSFAAAKSSVPTIKNIQIALTNAGYNPGNVDGRMGRQTREAIKAFQSANNLKSDAEVGKSTWALLKEYLNKKVK
jgi:peptidoglycan hydrolase-like protein with peptidoglycan-binding domain